MFISFGMFIALIIVTIIMIALIIYLTFTGGDKKSHHDNTRQAEQAAKERLAQNDLTTSSQTNDVDLNESNQQYNFNQDTYNDNRYTQEPQYEETVEEDYSLHVLPYPKDDDFK
ncbi:hypothetical protein [Enterococcus sp. AZ126]|uniref:hypothetical protein n=1 Tax=Enterococcus sp. AZ126 TaxID=2774635 RepID=UPI003F215B39